MLGDGIIAGFVGLALWAGLAEASSRSCPWAAADEAPGFDRSGRRQEVPSVPSVGASGVRRDRVEPLPEAGRAGELVTRPRSTYRLTGGELAAESVVIDGCGGFVEIGGISEIRSQLRIGDQPWLASLSAAEPLWATYELIGGELATRGTSVGAAGVGSFSQAGGAHTVDATLPVGGAGCPWLEAAAAEPAPGPDGPIIDISDGGADLGGPGGWLRPLPEPGVIGIPAPGAATPLHCRRRR